MKSDNTIEIQRIIKPQNIIYQQIRQPEKK